MEINEHSAEALEILLKQTSVVFREGRLWLASNTITESTILHTLLCEAIKPEPTATDEGLTATLKPEGLTLLALADAVKKAHDTQYELGQDWVSAKNHAEQLELQYKKAQNLLEQAQTNLLNFITKEGA